jgi:pimeloyl-ACP methyl ester carboxylesterase
MLIEILERRLIFQPRPVCDALPTDLGMDYAESWADTPDGRRLHCWHIPGDGRTDLTWLWFGGVGGNLSLRVGEFGTVRKYTGANIFGFDYGGFGYSEGKASVRSTAIDARTALTHLQSRYDVGLGNTLYMGVSLGAAVAIRLAAETSSPKGAALIAPFASLVDMARLVHPVITIGGRLVGNRFHSMSYVSRIGCPLIILHGSEDALVPPAQGRKLFAAAAEPKQFAEIPGADHLDLGDTPEFWDALCGWLDALD